MIQNYLKVAIRTLLRYKVYSLANIMGLAVGMSAFILIALLLQNENSYDKHNVNFEKIYRVQQLVEYENDTQEWTQTVYPLSKELRDNFSEFEKTTVCCEIWGEYLSSQDDIKFYEEGGFYAETDFFEIFSVDFIKGSAETMLENPNSIVLSEKLAAKLFPDEDPMNKLVKTGAGGSYLVTGMYKDFPVKSHIRPTYFVSFNSLDKRWKWDYKNNWESNSFRTYVMLPVNISIKESSAKIRDLLDNKVEKNNKRLYLRPLADLHLRPTYEAEVNTPLPYYAGVAIFILILACINYINLTTAKSSQREKEIGIRKVVGGSKLVLFKQFIGESLVITQFALVGAFLIAQILLPTFNSIMDRQLEIQLIENFQFVLSMYGIFFVVGLISGIYPALYLSSFNPIAIIKGQTGLGVFGRKGKGTLRRILVGFQFTISITLIISTFIIYKHVEFIKNKDLGFNKNNLLHCVIPKSESKRTFEEMRLELLKNPNVINAAVSQNAPFYSSNGTELNWEGAEEGQIILSRLNYVGYNFLDTYEMKLVNGRNFSREHISDTSACLVNETFVAQIGWSDPIGKRILDNKFRIIGVVKDFHPYSVHEKIPPYFMIFNEGKLERNNRYTIRINERNVTETMAYVNNVFEQFFPDELFNIHFFNDNLDANTYKVWQGVQDTFGYFTFIAIMIALMGIFGLIAYSVQKRTKEIGIRKVLGASINGLYLLINKEFIIILVIANAISWPFSYYFSQMTPGAYKYQPGPFDIIIPAVMAIIIAFIATAYISVKAALTNPAETLKDE